MTSATTTAAAQRGRTNGGCGAVHDADDAPVDRTRPDAVRPFVRCGRRDCPRGVARSRAMRYTVRYSAATSEGCTWQPSAVRRPEGLSAFATRRRIDTIVGGVRFSRRWEGRHCGDRSGPLLHTRRARRRQLRTTSVPERERPTEALESDGRACQRKNAQ